MTNTIHTSARLPSAVPVPSFAPAAARPVKSQTVGDVAESAGQTTATMGHAFENIGVFAPRPAGRSPARTGQRDGARPRLRLRNFGMESLPDGQSHTGLRPDKSTAESTGEQDQTASLTSFSATARGVAIEVDGVGLYSSDQYPGGFRWTQTIDSNVPLGGTTSPYVDPRPNDDTKPFYWTDGEELANTGHFSDRPSRNPPATGTTNWDAILGLNGVNGTTVTLFDSLTYGFSIDSSGTVTTHAPTAPASTAVHTSTLAGEFPGWTFN